MLARAALGLYPAAWRARYGDEVRALLDDSGAGLRAAASLVWRAVPAWIWPARHLFDRPARMRASLATVLVAWAVLAGLAAVFLQLTQAQPTLQDSVTGPGHLVIQWSYWVFDGAITISLLAVAVGGLPLWWLMMGRARSEHRTREMAYLLAPVVVPAVYLAAGVVTVSLVRRPGSVVGLPGLKPSAPSVVDVANGMVGAWWFLALIVLGFAAGGISAAGPGLALRRLRPAGPPVTRAARAAGLAVAAMVLAGAASIVAAVGLYQWAPAYHQGWELGVYLPIVLLAAAVAIVSAGRGIRAARSPAAA
ncbi:MAG TPA: hypothetical protein DHU96_01015 [Actinobacteria bacterium]|nr:hypothetical protein [Actinomycetota bacterium]